MFPNFESHFSSDPSLSKGGYVEPKIYKERGLKDFFENYGGLSFNDALYRVIHPADLPSWEERIIYAYPDFRDKITCFGFDWLGSVFALDSERLIDGEAGVVMFEPSTGKALKIPSTLRSFHEVGLMEFGEAALAISFHSDWLDAGGVVPSYHQCVGYKTPMFLGGADDPSNLSLSDIDVYWHLTGQLIRDYKGLPEGSSVRVKPSEA